MRAETRYETLLLIRDGVDKLDRDANLMECLKETSVLPRIKLHGRHAVEVRLADGKPSLHIAGKPGPEALSFYRPFMSTDHYLLCQNPSEELRGFHEQVGTDDGKIWEFSYDPRPHPYPNRRLLRWARKHVDIERAKEELPVRMRWGLTGEDGHRAVLQPERIPIRPRDAFSFMLSVEGQQSLLQKFTVGLLPPYRVNFEGTYFEAQHAEARGLLDALIESSLPEGAPPPAAVELWGLCEESCYRDILLEGGGLRLACVDDKPSAVRLGLHADASDYVARWRQDFILDQEKPMGPEWIEGFRRAVCSDLREPRAGVVVNVERVAGRGSAAGLWDLPDPEPREATQGPSDGSWNLIKELLERAARARPTAAAADGPDEDPLAAAESWILHPTRGGQGYEANHAYAEQLFMRHLWHLPWPEGDAAADESWRRVMIEIIHDLVSEQGRLRHPAERSEFEGVELTESGGRYVLTHGAEVNGEAVTEEMILTWRLLLPLGSVVRARKTRELVLNVGRLDVNQLAGRVEGSV